MAKATQPPTEVLPVAKAGDDDDDHRGIPRDAEGIPTYLILPPEMRASYDRDMANCEARWLATRDLGWVREAVCHVHLHRQPPPLWLSEAVVELTTEYRAKAHVERIQDSAVRMARYYAVREGIAKEVPWTDDKVFEYASERLKGTQAAGGISAVKKAYRSVRDDLKAGRIDRYNDEPKTPQMKLGDALKGGNNI
jgi:hypothetical protein